MPKETRKKKILYVITKSNFGGAQRYVFNLATEMKKEYDVAVALGGDGVLKTKLEEAGIRVVSLPWLSRDVNLKADLLVLKNLIRLFKEEQPDIIHVNSSKIGGLGALAGRIARVPKIIFTAHGWAFREERPEVQKAIIKFLSWLTILFSHTVITVSKRDEEEGLSFPFSRGKITLIHNGRNEPKFLEKEEARARVLETCGIVPENIPHYSAQTAWFGTVGELHKNKGHSFLIEALAQLSLPAGFVCVIFGEGEERAALEEKIRSLNLNEKIFLPGKKESASSLLRAFDVFLFPSIKEGLPYAVLEAGLAGIPSIASAVGGIPEIIQDMESGILVRPKSSDEIVKALEFLAAHPKKAREFGKKLRANVRKDFSFKKMMVQTIKVYQENTHTK